MVVSKIRIVMAIVGKYVKAVLTPLPQLDLVHGYWVSVDLFLQKKAQIIIMLLSIVKSSFIVRWFERHR